MKRILRFLPRSFLIRMSLFLRPLLRIIYGGNKFTDPIDGSGYRKFLPYGYGKTLRPNALCPGTLSLERHRLLWLYLDRETHFLNQELKRRFFKRTTNFFLTKTEYILFRKLKN